MSLEQLWNKSGLLFGKMWEDPKVEQDLMWQDNARRVLCVASAGDTAFALASRKGVRVTALDINPAQVHLCRLKQALLEVGTLPTALQTDARRLLEHVEPILDFDTHQFWQRHRDLLKSGVTRCGRVDHVMSLWAWLFRFLLVSEEKVRELLNSDDPAHQRALFRQHWDGRLWRWAFRIILHPLVLGRVYPKEFVRLLPADLAQTMRKRMVSFLTGAPAKTNPYLWQTFLPQETNAPRPPYLDSHGRVTFRIGTVASAVRERGKYDFFALSNILEVASPKMCASTLAAVKAMARPGALVVLRFMFCRPPVWPQAEYLETESTEAQPKDRAFFCNEFQIYRMP
jgi:S-adenosylmethionine:diacylglycerol 3-amino-3-carboxypropyl transferase